MTDKTPASVDAETQTVIRVYPHVFDHIDEFAQITSDKKMQSVIAMKPNEDTAKFFSLLRFTPYTDIKEDSIRVLDLERKKKLQFVNRDPQDMADMARQLSLADDDGVGELCSNILRGRLMQKGRASFFDASAQTDVKVKPFVLQELQVATVSQDKGTQTISTGPAMCTTRSMH